MRHIPRKVFGEETHIVSSGQCDGLEGVSNDICYSSDENPMWWMFIRAVKHYSDYINMLKDGVKFGGEYAKDNATNIVDHFSTQVDDSNVSVSGPFLRCTCLEIPNSSISCHENGDFCSEMRVTNYLIV